MGQYRQTLKRIRPFRRAYASVYPWVRQYREAMLRRTLRAALEGVAEPFVIKVGANDGEKDDPIWKLIQVNAGWQGIFVEPVPYVFDKLVSNVGENKRFALENLAIAEDNGSRELFYVSPDARNAFDPPLPAWYDEVASFSRHHVLAHFGDRIDGYIRSIKVPSRTLAWLCAAHHVRTLDLLHIDAEGYDYKVLRSLDFEKWRPRAVIYEHRHLNQTEQTLAVRFLADRNYRLRAFGPGMVAVTN